jgi:outer membrane protein assembly factor BamB
MRRQTRVLMVTGRQLVFSLLMLLGLVGLVATLVGGVALWQRLHVPLYQHTPNAINTGQSILYLSSPSFAAAPTQLTMVRTSDGATLWHYSLRGTLSSGFARSLDEALANGQGVEVANGVVYFVLDPNSLGSPIREQQLLALRADDGALLWQQPVQGAFVELFGVSDGVVCLRITQQQGPRLVSSALSGYNARTGSLTWQRHGSDVTGSQDLLYSVVLLDGILYVTRGAPTATSSSSGTIHALLARTGQTLWQYDQPPVLVPVPGARSSLPADAC